MTIHIVTSGETLESIANDYGISIEKLMYDNGITSPTNLVVGQSIVIALPETTYIIKDGDTLEQIAKNNELSVIELLANNPYLFDEKYLYPGDTIIIKYPKKESITTHGNTVPTINKTTLMKTLPYLTYLSILNYTATKEGFIKQYYDETEIVNMAKSYGVAPLMLLTTLTLQGEANITTDFDLLLNKEFQKVQIENILRILKEKGYWGLNISIQYISLSNLSLYEEYFTNVVNRLNTEGYQVFITINPNIKLTNNKVEFEKIDYSTINELAHNIIFTSYEWAFNANPPSPITSVYQTKVFLDFILSFIPPDKVIIGIATLGYDWELPYVSGISDVNVISYNNVNNLAKAYNINIQFDELSQTPYFTYKKNQYEDHAIWFINAKTIQGILNLVSEYHLNGISVWNITVYNPQLWLIINSQYIIEKVTL